MPRFDIEKARFNMVEQQIRPWETLEQQTLDLISAVPREKFVPENYHAQAFSDVSIPLMHGQVMMAPKIEARLLQALMVHPTDMVLEIGTGSGYMTALLAKAARFVDSIDIYKDFVWDAKYKLKSLNIKNVSFDIGNAINDWNFKNNYDLIVFTGSLATLDPKFQQQLNVGGSLFAIVGQEPAMQAYVINRITKDEFESEILFETSLPQLLGQTSTHFEL
ncbi:protein-L-isoaspartate O-methyltransferase [Candidatus Halobeggiatoa sp. HSG11]|nr:protein-L-isoaspartate O-methyltransferase [Candidatus Halobeggiatoa sp. HSG11]